MPETGRKGKHHARENRNPGTFHPLARGHKGAGRPACPPPLAQPVRHPAYIEAHFLRGATCADVLPELTAKNAAHGEYFAHFGAVVCCLRPYALTEEQANENSLLYLDRCEFRTVETGLYCDTVLPGSRTMTTCENWKIYRKEAAAL